MLSVHCGRDRAVTQDRGTALLTPRLLRLTPAFSPVLKADLPSAARANDSTAVLQAIAGNEDVNASMSDVTTALHWAVYNGNLELVSKLIEAGARVNTRNDYGSSPMSEAGVLGNVEIVAALLDAGADVESP